MKNNTLIWPVDGECNLGCEYYVEGSLEKAIAGEKKHDAKLICGFHCRFDGFKGEGACGANALNPDVTAERIKRAEEDE